MVRYVLIIVTIILLAQISHNVFRPGPKYCVDRPNSEYLDLAYRAVDFNSKNPINAAKWKEIDFYNLTPSYRKNAGEALPAMVHSSNKKGVVISAIIYSDCQVGWTSPY